MKTYQLEELSVPLALPSLVCLGMFDGVHLGHLRLIEEARQTALQKNLQAIVHTYDILPARVISPERAVWELTPFHEKIQLLEKTGIDAVAVSHFNEAFQHLSGEAFFEQILVKKLRARYIVAGFNHRFGLKADTDINRLAFFCQKEGIGLSVIPPVRTKGGALISSSAIRTAIQNGDLSLASEMLGRPPGDGMLLRAQKKSDSRRATQSMEVNPK